MQDIPTGQFIGGKWIEGQGEQLRSHSPADGALVWQGNEASQEQVLEAFSAARAALGPWWDQPLAERIAICQQFAEHVKTASDELAAIISEEMGKTLWEAKTEAGSVVAKVAVSIDALRTRRDETRFEMAGMQAVTRYKPYGVLSVLGPFNFPAHLPNGHIVPALLAGNTIVFKPSEQTPAVGAWMLRAWEAAGLPAGVLNLVQGGRDVGVAVSDPQRCDGLLFTGSGQVGRHLHQAFADYPQKILALEMGGNNPLVVEQVSDLDAAAYQTVLSAYITAGQRCTCARRLLLVEDQLDVSAFLERLVAMIGRLRVGRPSERPEPFYGTVINSRAGEMILHSYQDLLDRGATPLVPMKSLQGNAALLSPGLVDVTGVDGLEDEEVFGPLLTVRRVAHFDEAIEEANNTRYGLSAGLLSDNPESFQEFIHRIRAGIVNWNRQTTGASGQLPFGGCGLSGNHRPAGYFSADYCSYPTASLESSTLKMPEKLEVGVET